MGWLEMQRAIEHSRWHVHIPQFCDGIAAWWAERAVQAGIDARETTWRWTPPRREVVDPSREYPAMRDAMRAGSSRSRGTSVAWLRNRRSPGGNRRDQQRAGPARHQDRQRRAQHAVAGAIRAYRIEQP